MRQDLSQRIEELKLLGWSDDGATRYAQNLFDQAGFNEQWPNQVLIITFSIIFCLVCLILFILISNWKSKDLNKSSVVKKDSKASKDIFPNLDESHIKKVSNTQDLKISHKDLRALSVKPLKREINPREFIAVFKETSVNIDSVIEHLLLIALLFGEVFIIFSRGLISYFPSLLKYHDTSKLPKSSDILVSGSEKFNHIDFLDRKDDLNKKKNLELRNLLRGIPKTSKLNKTQLVDKILSIEFASPLRK